MSPLKSLVTSPVTSMSPVLSSLRRMSLSRKPMALAASALVTRPETVAQMNAAWMLLKAFCSEFGLSPVSRTRLAIEKPAAGEDDLLEILSQPRERKPEQPAEVIQ
jgi:hypothetical protein